MTAETVLAHRIRETLPDLRSASLPPEYAYASLPLCVIDSVFSIQSVYSSTQRTVRNWCQAQTPQWPVYRPAAAERWDGAHTVSEFLQLMEKCEFVQLADAVFKNRQRTSSRSGILKAEAVYRFAKVLAETGIEAFGDTSDSERNDRARGGVVEIPGQKSGVTFSYFLMMAGAEDRIKPDTMVRRFVSQALGLQKLVGTDEAETLVTAASIILNRDIPMLTPRLLDYEIWNYQRDQPAITTA